MLPTEAGGFDKASDETTQAQGDEQGAEPINAAGSGAARFRNVPCGNGNYRGGQRKINEECPTPGSVLHKPTTEHGADGGGDGGETGPGSDGLAAAVFVEACADDGEAAGDKQGRSYALNASRDD